MAKKPSMGRQKIKIAKIEIKNHLQVTFSKRRSGLYKKAHELSTLCGVELAIVVFSPAGKVFSFGNPNVDYVIDKFISRNKNSSPLQAVEVASRVGNGAVRELNSQLTQISNELEAEKKRGESFDLMRKVCREQNQCWWESPVSELGLDELEQLRNSMEELRKIIAEEAGKIMAAEAAAINSSSFFALNDHNGINGGAGSIYHQYESKPERLNPSFYSYGFDQYEHALF